MTPEFAQFIHYSTIGLIIGINSISVGVGQGLITAAALKAINIQPGAKSDIANTSILGMAITDTTAILSFIMSIIMILDTRVPTNSLYTHLATIGIALALCLPGLAVGLSSALPARSACLAVARQPLFAPKILRFMLLTLSILQTPIIFGFIVAFLINYLSFEIDTMSDAIRLISSGLCIGLGSIGVTIGLALFTREANKGLGVNPKSYQKILPFSIISQAIIEAPLAFSLIISMLLLTIKSTAINPVAAVAYFACALCMGLGAIAPGISSGNTSSKACEQISLHPEQAATISKVSMFSQGLIDACAIYALLIALIMLIFH